MSTKSKCFTCDNRRPDARGIEICLHYGMPCYKVETRETCELYKQTKSYDLISVKGRQFV